MLERLALTQLDDGSNPSGGTKLKKESIMQISKKAYKKLIKLVNKLEKAQNESQEVSCKVDGLIDEVSYLLSDLQFDIEEGEKQ